MSLALSPSRPVNPQSEGDGVAHPLITKRRLSALCVAHPVLDTGETVVYKVGQFSVLSGLTSSWRTHSNRDMNNLKQIFSEHGKKMKKIK